MVDLTELTSTARRLAEADARRANLVEYRDRQIVEVLASGATWAEVQAATGLSPRGVQLAIKRAHAEPRD